MTLAGMALEEALELLEKEGVARARVVDISTQRGAAWPALRVLRVKPGTLPTLTVCRFPEIAE